MSETANKQQPSSGQSSSVRSENGNRPKPKIPTAGKAGGNGAWSKKNKLRAQRQAESTSHTHVASLGGQGVALNSDDELVAIARSLDPFDHSPEGRAKRQEIFLLALEEFGTIKAGCRMVNISRQTYFDWIENFPEFKIAVEHAFMGVADDLEEEVFRRGKDKSDPLLMFAVKRFKPEYRDSYAPASGNDDEVRAEKLRAAQSQLTSKIKSLVERREANLALPPAGSEDEVDEDKIEPPKQLRRVKKKKW